jgi:2-methylcitrate dehydratase PrpD
LVKEIEKVLRVGEELADYIQNLCFDDLPKDVVHQSKRVLLDSLGTIFMGLRKEEAIGVTNYVKNLGVSGKSTIVGASLKSKPAIAAFANASYAQVHDCNDGHRKAAAYGGSSHPGRVAIPAALALAEDIGASGEDMITAIVLGYDVATKIRGMKDRPPSSTYSTAAIASRLLGLDKDQIRFALGIASYNSPRAFPGNRGYDTNFLINGYHVKVGIEAALLAKEGLKGPPLGDDRRLSTRFKGRGLGKEFEIMNVYIKPYPTCRMTHGAVDGVLKIKNENGLEPDIVEEVRVHQLTHGMYITDDEVGPDSYYKTCQFNLPYIVACAITDGKVEDEQFTYERIADQKIHELADKIKVIPDESLDVVYPEETRPTTVEVKTIDGKTHTVRIDYPKGEPRNPLSDDELYEKFVRWSGTSLTPDKAKQIRETVYRLESLGDLSELCELLSN